MTGALVRTSVEDGIALLTLNRPERHNALVPELLADLVTALRSTDGDAVVLAAAGRSFSTGGDVAAFWEHRGDLVSYAEEVVGLLNEVIVTMATLPRPVVAAVHGTVTGGSLGLLLGADAVVLAPEATLTPWYSVVGFAPDGGWTAVLPEVIGRERVERILAENRTITASQACAWGLGSRLVAAPDLGTEATRSAERLAGRRRSPLALRVGDLERLEGALDAERRAFVDRITSPQAREGMRRFLQRRRQPERPR